MEPEGPMARAVCPRETPSHEARLYRQLVRIKEDQVGEVQRS